MAKVKVYLPTFRRHGMLPRAVESLRSQTFKDWICEVHNDDPSDNFPEELVMKVADPRIRIVNHPVNLGGAATMNGFYRPVKEEFVSILEDDNWWEPEFLQDMLKAADRHPYVTVFWANMKIWQEKKDGTFYFTGKTTHPTDGQTLYEEFWWPSAEQLLGAVHSNGSCLIRTKPDGDYRIPKVPQAVIENFRERAFPQPLLLVCSQLANFSLTQTSGRGRDIGEWGESLAVLAATFIANANWPSEKMRKCFAEERAKKPSPINSLLNAALLEPKARIFFKLASGNEIIRWVGSLLKRPKVLARLLTSKQNHFEWWSFLEKHTADRFREARQRSETSNKS